MTAQGASPSADSVRRVIDLVLADPVYDVRVATDPWAPVRRAWGRLLDWIEALRTDNPAAYRLLVWSLIAILAVIVAHAFWVAARTMRAGTARRMADAPLPQARPRDAEWYAREAARLAAAGDLAGAMQHDFLRLVLDLDARDLARFHPSKTPSEYAREVRLGAAARQEFRQLVHRLYAHAFARIPTSREDWEAWQRSASTTRYADAH